jgi:hypothetical protein
VPSQNTLPGRAEFRDRGLRPVVDEVSLDLDPAEPAVVESVLHQQQLALGVDRR